MNTTDMNPLKCATIAIVLLFFVLLPASAFLPLAGLDCCPAFSSSCPMEKNFATPGANCKGRSEPKPASHFGCSIGCCSADSGPQRIASGRLILTPPIRFSAQFASEMRFLTQEDVPTIEVEQPPPPPPRA